MRSTVTPASRTAHTVRTARSTHRAAAVKAGRKRAAVRRRGTAQPVVVVGTRLTRRGRLVVVLGLVALLFAAFSYGRAGTQAATSVEKAPTLGQTTVQAGESLWTVAERIAPSQDPREVIQQIRQLNDLSGSGIQAGQQLLLPA